MCQFIKFHIMCDNNIYKFYCWNQILKKHALQNLHKISCDFFLEHVHEQYT
jgi:hypothetical protein